MERGTAKCPIGLLEEELKTKVAADWFSAYDTTRIIGKVDFCVAVPATELGLFESEEEAKECFASHFMSDFLAGKGRAVCLKPPFGGCGGLGQTALPGLVGKMSHAEGAENAEGEDGGCANALCSPRSPREIQISPASGKEQMSATSDDVKYNDLLAAECTETRFAGRGRQFEKIPFGLGTGNPPERLD